jgi:aspartyl-tRNA(Asn)/glutamyl-tRNA(Gln) amidotransferase subunit A
VPQAGAFPLSTTLDSIGPLGRSVACCTALDAILAGETDPPLQPRDVRGLRIAIPKSYVLGEMDDHVAGAFAKALSKLSTAGAIIDEIAFPEIDAIPAANARGGFAAPESLSTHRKLIEERAGLYDKRVLVRIERGHEQSASDYIDLVRTRARLIAGFEHRMRNYDLLVYPTVPIIPPPIAAFDLDAEFTRLNLLILRNPSVINMLDGCAISVPMSRLPDPPAGLMLAAPGGHDRRLLSLAASVEGCVA